MLKNGQTYLKNCMAWTPQDFESPFDHFLTLCMKGTNASLAQAHKVVNYQQDFHQISAFIWKLQNFRNRKNSCSENFGKFPGKHQCQNFSRAAGWVVLTVAKSNTTTDVSLEVYRHFHDRNSVERLETDSFSHRAT